MKYLQGFERHCFSPIKMPVLSFVLDFILPNANISAAMHVVSAAMHVVSDIL